MALSITNGYGLNPYAGPNATGAGAAGTSATPSATDGGTAARAAAASVNVSLSDEARAALAAQSDTRSIGAVVSSARSAIDRLLADAKTTDALKDGKATISLASMDRRSLFAVASNQGGQFSTDEQVVAALQLKASSDAALAPATAAMRSAGDYTGLYKAALANLDLAGPEERATAQWAQQKAAATEGLKQVTAHPGAAPSGIAGDPVAAYLKQIGGVVANPATRDINAVAVDVRAVIDKQYAAAGTADGSEEASIDFSKFDDRSLAAVALNKGGLFSAHEVAQAAAQVADRNGQSVRTAYASAASGAGDFGKSLITQYAGMSAEERDAAGWTPEFYAKLVSNQDMSAKLAAMFNPDGSVNTGGVSLLDYI